MSDQRVPVTISAACARQRFAGCEPEYIRTVCCGACCRSSVHPSGVRIVVLAAEEPALAARGGAVCGGWLQPRPGQPRCPFQGADALCALHGGPDKPLGCVVSPWLLTPRGTLIVRNRYRLLRCYNDGQRLPAYRAFAAGLSTLFGPAEAARITAHLDAGGGDLRAALLRPRYDELQELAGVRGRAQ